MLTLIIQVPALEEMLKDSAQVVPEPGNVVFSGVVTVFFGLIFIALLILLFNIVFTKPSAKKALVDIPGEGVRVSPVVEKGIILQNDIEDDILAAIGTTIELYKRLHMNDLQSKVNFRHGREQSGWKAGMNYGHRK